MNPTALKRYNISRLSLKISSGMSKENFSSVALKSQKHATPALRGTALRGTATPALPKS